jgi:hypothetical protein
MKITLTSTNKIVELSGVPARIWEGETESGIKVHAYITRIAVDKNDPRLEEFEQELQQHEAPKSADILSIPLRLIL